VALLLLREILAGTARLPNAACIGRHELFDPVVGNGHRYQRQEQTGCWDDRAWFVLQM
jgi:hypothetical protein